MIRVARRLGSLEVIETLAEVMLWQRNPGTYLVGQHPEFIAEEPWKWLAKVGTGVLYTHSQKSLGERLLRELQRKDAGRVLEWRDLLLA